MNSVIHLGAFQERFVSGLIYSMLEGLGEGQSLVVTSPTPLDDFRAQLEAANIEGIRCGTIQREQSLWSLPISRKSKETERDPIDLREALNKSS